MQHKPKKIASRFSEATGRIVAFLLKHPRKSLCIVGIIFCLAFSVFIKRFDHIDNALPVWFDQDSPEYQHYQNFIAEFGEDRMLLTLFVTPDAFSPKALQFVQTLGEALKKHRYVTDVLSLTEQERISSDNDDIKVEKLFATIPTASKILTEKRNWALAQKEIQGLLTNHDGTLSVVIAYINNPDNHESNQQTFAELTQIIHAHNTHAYPTHFSGVLANEVTFNELTLKNQQRFLVIMLITIFAVIYIFFRNFYIAFLPLTMMIVCIVITQTLFFFFNPTLNLVTSMMGPILMAACIADGVHAILGFNEHRAKQQDLHIALIDNAKEISIPCFFTALTTFAGFISFNVSPIVPNQQLGYFSAFGVMLAYALTLFLIPLLISVMAKKSYITKQIVGEDWTQTLLAKSFLWVRHHHKRVLLGFVVLACLSFWGMTKIKIETNTMQYFPKDNPRRIAGEVVETELAGIGSLEILLSSSDVADAIGTNPMALQNVETFIHAAAADAMTTKVIAYTDWIKALNQAWHNQDPAQQRIPKTRDAIAQLVLLAETSEHSRIGKYLATDHRTIRVTVKCHWKSSEELNAYANRIVGMAKSMLNPNGISVTATGQNYLWVQLDSNLLKTEFLSFGMASLLVLIMMMVILQSVRAGFITLIPNILPIFMAMGAMGFLKIHLNLATVMTAGIAIGITVDDSIHYLVKFKRVLAKHKDYILAIQETNKSIGTAVIFNSIILMFGFLVLCASNFLPSRYFGTVTALTIFLSIFCEILLMPVLLLIFKPFKIR